MKAGKFQRVASRPAAFLVHARTRGTAVGCLRLRIRIRTLCGLLIAMNPQHAASKLDSVAFTLAHRIANSDA